jgi:hypothetical protein
MDVDNFLTGVETVLLTVAGACLALALASFFVYLTTKPRSSWDAEPFDEWNERRLKQYCDGSKERDAD